MTDQPNTPTPISDRAASRAFERQAHHGAADELIENAIDMLSLLEMLEEVPAGENGEPALIPCRAVAVQASQIVKILRAAQSHHREVLP